MKDLIDVAGVRTTYGSRLYADHVPAAHAHVVERVARGGCRDRRQDEPARVRLGCARRQRAARHVPQPGTARSHHRRLELRQRGGARRRTVRSRAGHGHRLLDQAARGRLRRRRAQVAMGQDPDGGRLSALPDARHRRADGPVGGRRGAALVGAHGRPAPGAAAGRAHRRPAAPAARDRRRPRDRDRATRPRRGCPISSGSGPASSSRACPTRRRTRGRSSSTRHASRTAPRFPRGPVSTAPSCARSSRPRIARRTRRSTPGAAPSHEWRRYEPEVDLYVSPCIAIELPPEDADELEVRLPLSSFLRWVNLVGWAGLAIGDMQLVAPRDETVLAAGSRVGARGNVSCRARGGDCDRGGTDARSRRMRQRAGRAASFRARRAAGAALRRDAPRRGGARRAARRGRRGVRPWSRVGLRFVADVRRLPATTPRQRKQVVVAGDVLQGVLRQPRARATTSTRPGSPRRSR